MADLVKTIAFRIKQMREDHGLTQEKLGKLIGLTEQAVSNIERGSSTSFPTLKKLAKVFNCEETDFAKPLSELPKPPTKRQILNRIEMALDLLESEEGAIRLKASESK